MSGLAVAWHFLNKKYNAVTDDYGCHGIEKSMGSFWDAVTFLQTLAKLLDELRNVGVIIDDDTVVHNILTEFSQDLKSSSGQSQ